MMITVDIPYAPIQDSPVVQVAQATPVARPLTPRNKTVVPRREVQMEYCQDVETLFENSAFNSLPVLQGVLSYLGYQFPNNRSDFNAPPDVLAAVRNSNVIIFEAPQHGTVARSSPQSYFWKYTPEAGYQGIDRVVFTVEVLGRRYRIAVNLLVHEVVDEGADPRVCETVFRKGSSSNDPGKPSAQVANDDLGGPVRK